MRIRTIALVAAMLSTAAFAGGEKGTGDDHAFEVEGFESSMGQGRLGMLVLGLTPDLRSFFGAPRDKGLLVGQIMSDSPAARAGIQVGDVVTKIGGDSIDSPGDLILSLTKAEARKQIVVELVRDRQPLTVRATIGGRGRSPRG